MAKDRHFVRVDDQTTAASLGNWLIWRNKTTGRWHFYHEDSLRLFTTANDSDGLEQISTLIREHGDNAIRPILLLWGSECFVSRQEIALMKKHLFRVVSVSTWGDVIRLMGE